MSLPFLLEIGTEEIPDWMIPGALESLKGQLAKAWASHGAHGCHAAPAGARAEGLPERLPDTEERVMGPPQVARRSEGRGGFRAQAGRQRRRSDDRVHAEGRILHLPAQGRQAAG